MTTHTEATEYHRLREELSRLRAEPHPDMQAIERVLSQLDAAQMLLKAQDGQPGNNPIRNRYD